MEFLLSLSNQSKSRVPQTVLTRQISPKHGLPGNIQAIHNLAVLDYILELDYPQYSGTRLHPALRTMFININNTVIEGRVVAKDPEQHRKYIYEALMCHYSPEKVYFGPTLPHFGESSDIILCLNNDLDAMEIPKMFQNELKARKDIVQPPLAKDGYDWHCIVMPKDKHVTQQSGSLNGHWSMKMKHLEKLGFKVHTVVYKQYVEFKRTTNRNVTKSSVKSLLHHSHIGKEKGL